ncbi:MAG TPA: hypothetical protein VN112_22080 [Ensifer sp.]|nr:hypothetical protein [Ensifer sp.]
MNWVPVVFIIFKVGVLGIGMFFSIKWHYDQGKSSKPLNIPRIIVEGSAYLLAVVIIFALLYALFHYLKILPAGLVFY